MTTSSHQPRLSIFYGDTDVLTKGEATYEQWRFEIKGLIHDKSYKMEVIQQAIRRSVRGEASRILRRIGYDADIKEIIQKFDGSYGVVDDKESLMAEFYGARQSDHEDVTAWAGRIEDLLNKAVEKGFVKKIETNNMLRGMLWRGLRQDMKDISGYKYDAEKDFERLMVELRKIEQDHIEKKGTTHVAKRAVESDTTKEIAELKEIVHSVATSMKSMGEELKELKGTVYSQQNVQDGGSYNRQQEPRAHFTQRREDRKQNSQEYRGAPDRQYQQPNTRYKHRWNSQDVRQQQPNRAGQ